MPLRFGPFRADRLGYVVTRGDAALPLTPKLLDLLFYLLDRPGTLVTKEALLNDVWPNANVTDNALAQAISELREALGDSSSTPTFIRTVARRGYRFVAPVTEDDAPAPPVSGVRPPAVAVLDLVNVTREPDLDWLAAGIAETVTSDLAALGGFPVIDRWRVVQAARRAPSGAQHEIAAALGATRLVTGSYQHRAGDLRITARLVDLARDEVLADAKVDGQIADVFALQDGIVAAFARGLGVANAGARITPRETSNLDAFRAYTEGSLRIESLDTDLVAASIADFERAIARDPHYAMAFTGLANAEFVAYEMTRAERTPDLRALESGLSHARHAVHLDPRLAEAHATLSFLLVSAGRFDEARDAAHTAVTLEPESWRHQYRLGHALWGEPRLRALDRAVARYPQFGYARFEAAMVHVARGAIDLAEAMARSGVVEQDEQARTGHRYPVLGFHWLLGAIDASRGRFESARAGFDRELAQVDARRLYGPEYGALALAGRAYAELALGHADAALASFREARTHVADAPRAWIGEADALGRLGQSADAAAARARAREIIVEFDRTGRRAEALYLSASEAALDRDPAQAVARLDRLLALEPPAFPGWSLTVDPAFDALRRTDACRRLLAALADRAK